MFPRFSVTRSRNLLSPSQTCPCYRTKGATAISKSVKPSNKKSQTSKPPKTSPTPHHHSNTSSHIPSKIPIKAAVTSNHDSAHDTLESFLQYADETNLSRKSTVFQGTLYEYLVQSSLRRLGFTLRRVGGAHDLGIDLIGHWRVPSSPIPIRVLVQCKAHSKILKPENVRELEGAFGGAPEGHKGEGVLAWLVGKNAASRGVQRALTNSRMPMGFAQIDGGTGLVKQFLWNHEAAQWGLEGLGVTMKYADRISAVSEALRSMLAKELIGKGKSTTRSKRGSAQAALSGMEMEVVLTWEGWAIQRSPDPEPPQASSDTKKQPCKSRVRKNTSTEAAAEGQPGP